MDEFRLVEVIVMAQRILDECVPISKTSLGGLALVGNMKGLFVAVNGPAPGGERTGAGSIMQRGSEEDIRITMDEDVTS